MIMLLQLTALAAVAATAPPFKTAVGLRPAARGLQDFAECPVLTKIKKDDRLCFRLRMDSCNFYATAGPGAQ